MKRQKIQIFTLIVAFALCMAAMCASFILAGAANGDSIDNDNIFTVSNGATNVTPGYTEGQDDYVTFRLSDDRCLVSYRRNLALKWFESNSDTADNAFDGKAVYFSLTIGIDTAADFDEFTVALESSQFSISKEGKTTNKLVFKKENGNLTASVADCTQSVTVTDPSKIEIALANDNIEDEKAGSFDVLVNGEDAGQFTNIGKFYSKYASSSTTTPLTPLAFSATGIGASSLDFTVQQMNGQSFVLNKDGDITDDADPVLVLDNELYQLYLGIKFDIDYVTVDVCSTSSVTTKQYYYLKDSAEERSFDENNELVGYTELSSTKVFFEGAGVSIAYKVTSGSVSTYYFAEWYAGADYIPLVNAEDVTVRPTMNFITYDETTKTLTTDQDKIDAYQSLIAAASQKDGKSIQVGTGAYYYIPAMQEYVDDPTCGYKEMKFTIYYRTNFADTKTVSGAYDELRIQLTAEGHYELRIVPTNAAGKAMAGLFENEGNLETPYKKGDITSSNVFDAVNLPSFDFSVEYTGPVIEEPKGDDDTGYVDVTYKVEDFEIVALDGYKTKYTLYYFTPADSNASLSKADILGGEQADGTNSLGEWKKIEYYDSELGDDEGDNVYNWNPGGSLSFVPQAKGVYKVSISVSSDNMDPVSASKYIEVSSSADVIHGDTYWLENNVIAIVFLGIAVLCLIGIVVLLLIKPKEKTAAVAEKTNKKESKKDE